MFRNDLRLFIIDFLPFWRWKRGLVRAGSRPLRGGHPREDELLEWNWNAGQEKMSQLLHKFAQVIPSSEKDLPLCPNLCSSERRVRHFCAKRRRRRGRYEPALGAEVKRFLPFLSLLKPLPKSPLSDRCCDSRRCVCVCHFSCLSLAAKERQWRVDGYRGCAKSKSSQRALQKAKRKCQRAERGFYCGSRRRFICPKQFLCAGRSRCVACIKPDCADEEEYKLTKAVIAATKKSGLHAGIVL